MQLFIKVGRTVASGTVNAQLDKMAKDFEYVWVPETRPSECKQFKVLPSEGLKEEEVIKYLTKWAKFEKRQWDGEELYQSGCVYHGAGFQELSTKAFELFHITNGLHLDTFIFTTKMSTEIVSMTAQLFNPTKETCGLLTSGGTESIILAVKSFRDWGKTKGITEPELVIPVTAHAAFCKGCEMMNIKIVKVPIHYDTWTVDLIALEKAINKNTIGIVGSSPNFPYGTIDPIPEMAKIARKHNIQLHVDCCLGSFMVPILKQYLG
eukprot:UN30300